jgi:hypothetical protein
MQALRTSIITINNALTVSVSRRVVITCLFMVEMVLMIVILWQSLEERAKGWADLLKDAAAKEQRIVDLEKELK